jgi:tetratricopeptide (TPR) repeat protein
MFFSGSTHSRRGGLAGIFVLLALLSGCATQSRALLDNAPASLPRQTELATTPFFPQERYQCGPAALAMSLTAAGIPTTPDILVPQVYLPQREGSLQIEMLAAGRRNGAVSMAIPPRLDALLLEIAAGNPVVVLQNLSLPWFPRWHYALAIGYDLDHAEIILRSGLEQRQVIPLSTFEHTWGRSRYWGITTLPPGRLAATAEEAPTMAALVAFEHGNDARQARLAYSAALQRWPRNLTLLLGLGNTAYAAGERRAAAEAFRRAAESHPDSAPALNNLAVVLSDLGEFDAARRAAQQALALGAPWRDEAQATLRAIDTARRQAAPH